MMPVEHSSEDIQPKVVHASLEFRREMMAEHTDLVVCGQVVALAAMLKQPGS